MALDVGANAGRYAQMLRAIGYEGWIASFEPVAALYADLSAKTHGDAKWNCYQLALGDKDEERPVNVLNDSHFSSFLAPSTSGKALYGDDVAMRRLETVRVRALDSIFEEVVSVAPQATVLLKIDTQGWDLAVLRGAKRSCRHIDLLQAELSVKSIYEGQPSWLEFLTEAGDMGFELAGLYPVSYTASGAVIEFDGLFVRA